MNVALPELALVVLVGPSGAGKSTFARRHFKPTEILTSDFCRALVSDDENDQSATKDAFAVLQFIAGRRLARGLLTVVDATNVQPEARKPLIELAREYHVLPVAIVFNLPGEILEERSRTRTDRDLGAHVLRNQQSQLRRSLRNLQKEGFRHVWTLRSPEEVEAVAVERRPLWPDRRSDHGPFDLIGDIHGCGDELEELLGRLGYAPDSGVWRHPEGRKVVFLGDLVDRGPRVPAVLRIVMSMVEAGSALCVPGNHDAKLLRWLRGKRVTIGHGLERSIEQLEEESPDFRVRVAAFLDGLVSHYVLDGGKLVVAHAGMKQEMQGRASGRVRDFALYGETTGEIDELGLPVRLDWAAEYRGPAMVVYGHTPVAEPRVAQPHAQRRYRLRLRRRPHRPALPRAGAGLRARPRGLRGDAARVPDAGGEPDPAAGARRRARPRGRHRQADHPHPAAQRRHHPRGERGGGPGGDEPLRRRSQVARLPAADHVPLRDQPPAGSAGAPRRGVRLLPRRGGRARRLRGEAHGLAGRPGRLPRRRRGPPPFRDCRQRGRHLRHPYRPPLLRRSGLGAGAPAPGARGPRPLPGSGSVSIPTGSVSTPS